MFKKENKKKEKERKKRDWLKKITPIETYKVTFTLTDSN